MIAKKVISSLRLPFNAQLFILSVCCLLAFPFSAHATVSYSHATSWSLTVDGSNQTGTNTVVMTVTGMNTTSAPTTDYSSYTKRTLLGAETASSDTITIKVSGSGSHVYQVKAQLYNSGGALLKSATSEVGVTAVSFTYSGGGTDFRILAHSYADLMSEGSAEAEIWYGFVVIPSKDAVSKYVNAGGPKDNPGAHMDGAPSGKGPGICYPGAPRYFVNMTNLNLVLEDTEYVSSGLGPELAMTRTWNGLQGDDGGLGMFGKGWSFSYEAKITSDGTSSGMATMTKGSAQKFEFPPLSSSVDGDTTTTTFGSPSSGVLDTLQGLFPADVADSYYLFTDNNTKNIWRFDNTSSVGGTHNYTLTSITDRNGNAVTFARNADYSINTITDAGGRVVSFGYDSSGRCTSMTVPTGHSTTYVYNADGRLEQTSDLMDYTTTFTYDSAGLITAMAFEGKTTAFTYDETGGWKHVATITNPLCNSTGYYASDTILVTKLTQPGGDIFCYDYQDGKTTALRMNYNSKDNYQVAYHDSGLTRTVTRKSESGDDAVESFEYDARGNMTEHTDANGGVTTLTYDSDDYPLTITDALGNTTTYTYDAKGNLLTRATPLGLTTTYAYDAKGLITSVTHPDSSTETFAYDVKGNPTKYTDQGGNTWTYGYDAQGLHLTSITSPLGNTTSFTFDANKRLTSETLPNGKSVSYGYNCCTQTSITDPLGNAWSITRDVVNNPLTNKDPLDRTTTMSYDDDDNLSSVTSPMGKAVNFSYDYDGKMTGMTLPDSGRISYGIDKYRRTVSSVRDQNSGNIAFTYDGRDNVLTTTDQLGKTLTYINDALDRVATTTNRRGQIVAVSRDNDGRMTKVTHDGVSAGTFAWNDLNLLASYTDSTSTTTFTSNSLGQFTRIDYPSGKSVEMSYDEDGNLTSMNYPGGLSVAYTYNAMGQPTKISFDGLSIDIAYDDSGKMLSMNRSTGVKSTYTFDNAGQLTLLQHAGTSTIVDLATTYDNDGHTTNETGSIPQAPKEVGASVTANYDAAHAVSDWGGITPTYDNDGNLTSFPDSRNVSMTYDLLNRPISLTAGGVTREYTYDAMGNRVKVVQGDETRIMHFDHKGRLLCETNANSTVTAVNVFLGGQLVARGDGSGNFLFPLYDKIGSTLALTDESGAVTASFGYSPQGMKTASATDADYPHTFVGAMQVMDEGNDIYFMRNRYYDAVTGRFMQRDPMGLVNGPNLYGYAGNNPVSFIDPQGTWFFLAPAVAKGLAIVAGAVTVGGLIIYSAIAGEKAAEARPLRIKAAAVRAKLRKVLKHRDMISYRIRMAIKQIKGERRKAEGKCFTLPAHLDPRLGELYAEEKKWNVYANVLKRIADGHGTDADMTLVEADEFAKNGLKGTVQSVIISGSGGALGAPKAAVDVLDIINSVP